MRPLNVTSNEDAVAKGWQVEFGPGAKHPTAHRLNKPELCEGALEGWELVQKAWYDDGDERVLHTTKRLHVPGGWIYETHSEIRVMELVLAYDGENTNPSLSRRKVVESRSTQYGAHQKPILADAKGVVQPAITLSKSSVFVPWSEPK